MLSACSGEQSALAPGGEDAATIARIFWVMLWGAVVLWLAVNLAVYLARNNAPRRIGRRAANAVIIGGGVVLPLAVLTPLLIWGLAVLPDHRLPGEGLTIRVTGEQWWWRVEYLPQAGGEPVVAANEIRLPVGQRVTFELGARAVIHSLWIPALGGKMDMFPGRTTRLSLRATEPGVYRGQCAEFCGLSHAWMAFRAVAMPAADFAAWLEHEAGPAARPEGDAVQGADIFAREGCGACHTIRGTEHAGRVGPDLTHVGSRLSLGAGRLAPSPANFADWIAEPGSFKPGVQMPGFGHLPRADLAALGTYMAGLR
jgi:cytochrome c oxidase subunit 2